MPTALIIPLLLTINIVVNFESYLLIWLKAIACFDAVHSITFVKTYIPVVAQKLKEGSQKKFVCNYDQLNLSQH